VQFGPSSSASPGRSREASPSAHDRRILVLKVLVQHPRQPVATNSWSLRAAANTASPPIDVQISRLRKIVESDPAHPKHIQTVWGFGYVFVPDGNPQA
jgi:DNA-binding response OmpR family regulator